MTRMVQCVKLGREAEGLAFPPVPGELGKKIFESVSKEAWSGWQRHQTMLINENRLNLADPQARKYLMEQMNRYFFGGGNVDAAAGYVPPATEASTEHEKREGTAYRLLLADGRSYINSFSISSREMWRTSLPLTM